MEAHGFPGISVRPDPDFNRLDKVLRRQGEPDRVPFYEIFSEIEEAVLRQIGDPPLPRGLSRKCPGNPREAQLHQHVRHQYWLGYDYAAVRETMTGFVFPLSLRPTAHTAEGERSYMTQEHSTIRGRADMERYPWLDMACIDYSPFEAMRALLPEGMGIIGDSPGVFENVLWLLGYEGLSYMLCDDPELLGEVFQEVGSRVLLYFRTVASCDCVRALRYGDDLGFKTQLLIPPEAFRRFVLPWHQRIVAAAHGRGKPIILHSCGNLAAVITDILDTGWDARHSFEDVIEPVWEAKERYGDRIAHLGGFDMVKLPLMTEAEVRRHTRFLIERCAPGGGWALGSGNSIPPYVPVNNFLAMLDEGRRMRSG
jgi:uroporphyrinogen decarboxylase